MRNQIFIKIKPEHLTLREIAKRIYDQINWISDKVNIFEWCVSRKQKVNVKNLETLKVIEKIILKSANDYFYTKLKIEDYPKVSESVIFYNEYHENRFEISIDVGEYSSLVPDNSIIIKNYESIQTFNTLEKLKHFLIEVSNQYNPFNIEVMDTDLLRLKEFKEIEEKYKKIFKKKHLLRHGWLNYFSKDYPLVDIPSDFDLEILENGDKILYTTREEYSLTNEAHKNETLRINKYFLENGICLYKPHEHE